MFKFDLHRRFTRAFKVNGLTCPVCGEERSAEPVVGEDDDDTGPTNRASNPR